MSSRCALVCLCLLASSTLLPAQSKPPTDYAITQAGGSPGATTTIYRRGSKALMVIFLPAQGATPASTTDNLIDIAAGTNLTWNPNDSNVGCSAGTFSGDWGDPFAAIADLSADIANGNLKPTGTETFDGISTTIYTGSAQGVNVKAWIDQKDSLLIRAESNAPNSPPTTFVDITKVSFAPPPASLFVLPAICAGVKPPPTPAQLIADETGDDASNYVSAFTGPGSQNSCNVVLRVVQAKTMAPLTHLQVAIDTQYDQNDPNPPHYTFGVGDDGTETFSGGHLRQITTGIHGGTVSLGTVPPYFNLVVNAVHPGHSGGPGLIYRQCFAPTTVLLFLYKDYGQQDESVDALWVKAGKNATPPAQ
jgi:hypothetical protein